MMSTLRWTNSGTRMCSMLFSEPVSRLSTQMTRCPRSSSASHKCDPRKPAPPVTREVGMAGNLSLPSAAKDQPRGRRPRGAGLIAPSDRDAHPHRGEAAHDRPRLVVEGDDDV